MNNDNKPQIRFKGYNEAWEQRKLGDDLIKEYEERTTKENQYPVLSSTMSGIYFQSEYFNQEVSTITNKGYKVVPLNFVTYRSMSDTDVFHFNVQNIVEKGIVSPAYPVFSTVSNVTNNYFLTYQMNESAYFYKQLQVEKEGGTRYALSYTKLCKLYVYNPSYIEQRKIANLFMTLDDLITLHQQKLDKYKEIKQFLLEKMFPALNTNKPEIRFKSFNDAWEQRKLGNIGICFSGFGFPEDEQGGNKGIPFYKVSDMNLMNNSRELIDCSNYVTADQIKKHHWKPILPPSIFFAKVGAAVLLNRKRLVLHSFLLDNNTMAFSFNDEANDQNFIYSIFQNINLPSLVQVGALPSYNGSQVENLDILVPTRPEQYKIGLIFLKLDHLITLHQQKLDKYKEIKQFLLGKMFV